ncbi:MAG: glycosyltransferase 87 family protein [Propionicimonas sp.]|uniref:glycosyltransferase 87 family protein n=1 Tax=Propionicimonas sp. TaxID=1955623 RepID=UPI003D100956
MRNRQAVAGVPPQEAPAPVVPSGRTTRRLHAVLVGAVVVGVVGAAFPAPWPDTGWLDLRVYRAAIDAALSGGSLYDVALPDPGSAPAPFLYPPFAALLGAPFSVLPLGSAATIWALCQLAMAGLLVGVLARSQGWPGAVRSIGTALTAGLVWVLFVGSRPVLAGVLLGQVSLLVTTLVVIDLMALPPRWKGVLVGLAGAVKLTPMVFLAYFLVTRQWRAAVNALVAFLAATALGFAVWPADSLRYWTSVILDAARVPGLGAQTNLSLVGQLRFWGVPDAFVLPAWVALGAVVLTLALRQAARRHVAGDEASALLTMGAASALVSPVAWDHYQVWLPLAAVLLVFSRGRGIRAGGWTLLVALGVLSPLWPEPIGPLDVPVLGLFPVVLALWISLGGLPLRGQRPLPEG